MLRNHYIIFFWAALLHSLAGTFCLAQFVQGNLSDTVALFKLQISKPFFMEIIVAMFWGI